MEPAYIDALTDAALHLPEPASRLLLAYPVPREFWRQAIYYRIIVDVPEDKCLICFAVRVHAPDIQLKFGRPLGHQVELPTSFRVLSQGVP